MASRPESAKGAADSAPVLHGLLRRCFRIADVRHPIFDGAGALLFGARWNSPGKRIIYAADSFAGAMLEMLVHTQIGRVPSSHQWIEIDIPKAVSVEVAECSAVPGWDSEDSEAARQFGDAWFDSRRSLLLFVPSIVTNGLSRNCLVNQEHPEFGELKVSGPEAVVSDAPLFGRHP